MKIIVLILTLGFLAIGTISATGSCASCDESGQDSEVRTTVYERQANQIIARAGRNHTLNDSYYITYEWDKRPRIGHHVLIVKLYSSDRKMVQDLDVTADAYMPSMRGAHDTGDVPMKLNNSGAYLVPVHFMMLGDWEIELKFNKDGKEITRAYVPLYIR